MHSECASYLACVQHRCKDPCPGSCGENAECFVVNHNVVCQCLPGYVGNPFAHCEKVKPRDPCEPNPCGHNARPEANGPVCRCRCLSGYFGDAYGSGCRRECEVHTDCALDKACSPEYKSVTFLIATADDADVGFGVHDDASCSTIFFFQSMNGQFSIFFLLLVMLRCVDPCYNKAYGICGENTRCDVINHNAICTCLEDFTGNPFERCFQRKYPQLESQGRLDRRRECASAERKGRKDNVFLPVRTE